MTIFEFLTNLREKSEAQDAMLKSMSLSLRAGLPFSFHPEDMADLLDAVRDKCFASIIG